jgi:CheY-like chemotaxis protein
MGSSTEWRLRGRDLEAALPLRGSACVVEVDEGQRKRVAENLRQMGFKTHETSTGAVARFIASQIHLQVVCVDITVPDMSGLALIRELRELAPQAVIVATSPAAVAGLPLFSKLAYAAGADSALGQNAESSMLCAAVCAGHHTDG